MRSSRRISSVVHRQHTYERDSMAILIYAGQIRSLKQQRSVSALLEKNIGISCGRTDDVSGPDGNVILADIVAMQRAPQGYIEVEHLAWKKRCNEPGSKCRGSNNASEPRGSCVSFIEVQRIGLADRTGELGDRPGIHMLHVGAGHMSDLLPQPGNVEIDIARVCHHIHPTTQVTASSGFARPVRN